MELRLPRTANGTCPIVVVFLGRRGTGKTTMMQATAPLFAPRERLVIVSPLNTLPNRMPDVRWYKVSIFNRDGIQAVFQKLNESGTEPYILADEGDELTAGSAGGVSGGFQTPAVYDTLNYARESGVGISISSRRPQNIAKDMLANANLVFVAQTTDPAALDWYDAFMQDPIHPDRDYRAICRTLPAVDTDGFSVFMVWSPGKKLLGYATVDMNTMEMREFKPEELRKAPPSSTAPTSAAASAPSTGAPITGNTGSTAEAVGNAVSTAASAARR